MRLFFVRGWASSPVLQPEIAYRGCGAPASVHSVILAFWIYHRGFAVLPFPDYETVQDISHAESDGMVQPVGSGSEAGSYLRLIDFCITQL